MLPEDEPEEPETSADPEAVDGTLVRFEAPSSVGERPLSVPSSWLAPPEEVSEDGGTLARPLSRAGLSSGNGAVSAPEARSPALPPPRNHPTRPIEAPLTRPLSPVDDTCVRPSGFRPPSTQGAPGHASDNEMPTRQQPPSVDVVRQEPQVGGPVPGATRPAPVAGADGAGASTAFPVAGYEILGVLGRGGMGVVYKARQLALGRIVALKMILAGTHASTEDLARFRSEAEAVALLQHPNIVQIYDVGERDGKPFFSLEYIEGGSLQQKVKGVPQPARVAARLLEILARAVHYAHTRGIIHRDLKPANVLLGGAPDAPLEQCVAKLTDFGLAKRLREENGAGSEVTATQAVLGTPAYMAPEQAQGRTRQVGPAADIYALGAVLYDLLTGEPPFKGTTVFDTLLLVQNAEPVPPRRHRRLQGEPRSRAIPLDLDTICLRCLEKAPERRYASAEALADDLHRFLVGEPIQARPVPTWERAWKWARRRPTLAALLACLVLGTALIVGLVVVKNAELDRANEDLKEKRESAERLSEELGQANAGLHRANDDLREKDENLNRAFLTAEAERAEAEKAFASAQHAIDELLFVAQKGLRNEPRMEPLRRKLLNDALSLAKTFVSKGTSPGARLRTARVRRMMGDLHERLQELPAAQASYEAAVALYLGLIEGKDQFEKAHRAECVAELLGVYASLWQVLEAQGLDGGKWLRKAESLRAGYRADANASPEARRVGAALLNNHGIHYLRRGDRAGAMRAFDEAAALLGPSTDRPELLLERARVEVNRGALLAALGRREEAGEAYQGAVNVLKPLQARGFVFRQELGRAYAGLAGVLHDIRGPTAAEGVYREAIHLFEKLRADSPEVADYAHLQALSQADLGRHYLRVKRDVDAETQLASAREILRQLRQEHPRSAGYRLDLVRVDADLGRARVNSGRFEKAKAVLEEAQAVLGPWRKGSDDRVERSAVYRNLLTCYYRWAEQLRERGLWAQVETQLRRLTEVRAARLVELRLARPALSLWRPWQLIETLWEEGEEHLDLADTHLVLANVLLRTGDDAGAARAARAVFGLVPADADAHQRALLVLGKCMSLALGDSPRPSALAQARALAYGKEILVQFRRASQREAPGLAKLATAPELALLRNTPALREPWRRLLSTVPVARSSVAKDNGLRGK